MIPFSGDYNPIISPYGTYAYTPPLLLINPFLSWMPQINCLQTINNLTFNTSVNFKGDSPEDLELKIQDCTPYFYQKPHNKKKSKLKVKIKKFSCDDDSLNLKNKIQNEESSYNNRRRRISTNIKKHKQGPQNKNRNILPSIVQQILSFITKQTKSKPITERIFAVIPHPEQVEVSIPRFYYYTKQIKEKQNHYVNEQTLKILCIPQDIGIDLFPEKEQKFYLQVARILAKHFLVNVSPFLTLYSKRIIPEKRIEHLTIRKVLLNMISQLHC